MALTAELWCVAAYLALAAVAVACVRMKWSSPLVYSGTFAVAMFALTVASSALVLNERATIVLPLALPWLGAHFEIDALSAFFLAVVNLGAAMASLFALGYGAHEEAPHRVVPFYPAFLAGMCLVVLAADAFTFLLSWEFMSLASWALVVAHHRNADNARAGYIYLVMASFGTLALLLAFGVLAGADGSYAFDAIRSSTVLSPVSAAIVLALVLIGAGSKAGLVPLHVWLPLAHPAAPSHVSALMSGVMTKVALYAFIRVVFDLMDSPEWWWSVVVLCLAGATTALGVLYALMQHDLKRLLAYHTVENIGIIFIGLGLALAFRANGIGWAGALALTAALFHVLNHSLFKSLLFFGAGAVLTATKERDLEHLGGLIHRMPLTAFSFLIGCVAISALPPLNGFVSEWLTFQAILLSPNLSEWGLKILVPGVGALLALSAALAAACFVKAFGVTFLSRPRSPAAASAKEVDLFSLASMFTLVALCLLAGVFPGAVIDALAPVAQALVGDHMPVQQSVPWLSIVPIAEARSSYNGLLVFLFILISASVAVIAIHLLASRAIRRDEPWDCGFGEVPVSAQYSADSFAQPIRRVFGTLVFRAREEVDMPRPGEMRAARLKVSLIDPIWDTLYAPIAGAVVFAADKLNVLQFLTIRRYLTLVFFALVALLFGLAVWP
jgi:formate hydrogenlyase subunit 3/multisubunit Na+/H+ antiporter MnhD subunit